MTIEKKVYEMSTLIRETKEYKDVIKMKNILARNPELYKQVKELQGRQRRISKMKITRGEMAVKYKELQENFTKIQKLPEVQRYMQCLMKLNQKIQQINMHIYENLEGELLI